MRVVGRNKAMNLKLSFITPTPYIREYGVQSDFHLGLSHLIDLHSSNEYERALLDTNLPIVLDNGLFENHFPEGIDSLFTKANRIKASIVFAPDYLYDKEKTIQGFKNFLHIMCNRKLNIGLGVVIQANNKKDYLEFYDLLQDIPEVKLIGLSILAIPRCFGSFKGKDKDYTHNDREITSSRIECLKELMKRRSEKPCHLLGLGDGLQDVIFASKNCPFVVSHDSSSAYWNAIQGKKILDDGSIEGGKTEIKVNFNFNSATKEQLELVQYNINKYKELVYESA